MAVSKVVYGESVLVDLTGDTVSASSLKSGETAHGADGNMIVGTALIAHTIRYYSNDGGTLLQTEIVPDGGSGVFHHCNDTWGIEIGGEVLPAITENVKEDLDLFYIGEEGTIYGFHVSDSYKIPLGKITYLEDAVDMKPAMMDLYGNEFDYGSWKDAFFMPRPCMLNYDGTVAYYLDEDDYTKKENGEESDINDASINVFK